MFREFRFASFLSKAVTISPRLACGFLAQYRCHRLDLVGSEPSVCLCLVEVGEYANMLLSRLSFWFAGKLFTTMPSDRALLLILKRQTNFQKDSNKTPKIEVAFKADATAISFCFLFVAALNNNTKKELHSNTP